MFCTPVQFWIGWGLIAVTLAYTGYLIVRNRKLTKMYDSSLANMQKNYDQAVAKTVAEYEQATADAINTQKAYTEMMKRLQDEQIPDPNKLPDPTVEVVDYYPD